MARWTVISYIHIRYTDHDTATSLSFIIRGRRHAQLQAHVPQIGGYRPFGPDPIPLIRPKRPRLVLRRIRSILEVYKHAGPKLKPSPGARGFNNLLANTVASGVHAFVINNKKLNANPGELTSVAG